MNTEKARELLRTPYLRPVPIDAHGRSAFCSQEQHLSDHDAEEKRLAGIEERIAKLEASKSLHWLGQRDIERIAGMEESIHNLNRRADEVEAKAFKDAKSTDAHKCTCGLYHYRSDGKWTINPKPAEPEQMVNADGDIHTRRPLCDALGCLPLSEFNRRKEAEKAKLDAEARAAKYVAKLNRDINPPKDERMPEPGDEVERPTQHGWSRVLAVCDNYALMVGSTVGLSMLKVLRRPALVPGEGVTHREHPEWGTGFIGEGIAWFRKGQCEHNLSCVKRTHWNPKLHEGKE